MLRYAETLEMIAAHRSRRPVRSLPTLDSLFGRLSRCRHRDEAIATEDRIWAVWMFHPHAEAAAALDRAAGDIAARRYDIAETRLTRLLRHLPDYTEAWHKRATLYYLRGEDGACVEDLRRTLEREPRHFGAMCSFAEILLGEGWRDAARTAFAAALALHPHLERARAVVHRK